MNVSSNLSLPARPQNGSQRRVSRGLAAAFAVSAATAIAWFFVPAFIIRPFTHQSARGLLLAMRLRQRAPWVTLPAALACFFLARAMWPRLNWRRRSLLALALLLVTFSAVMARLNYFEWMFHPIAGAQFLPPAQSKLDAKEMILAVRIGREDRAYPIRQMAYHHVLNDTVAGQPIVATY